MAGGNETHPPMDETEETTKVAHTPREAMTGVLAGLFGAIVLLAVVASGLVLRPPSNRAATPAGGAPPLETPSVASARPVASASASAIPAVLPPADAQRLEPSNEPDVEPASRRLKHGPKGVGGKIRKHRESTTSSRSEP
jgi:hypothetical protein